MFSLNFVNHLPIIDYAVLLSASNMDINKIRTLTALFQGANLQFFLIFNA